MKGWIGRIAEVNLSTGEIRPLHLDESLYHQYLGGVGLGARLLYDNLRPGVAPLSEGNVVAVMAGPVTGTAFPGVGRLAFCARSPLTGAWGQSSMGGYVGHALKSAGYDGLLIKGASEKPVYLHITPESISLRDADALWGLDTYDTERHLKGLHGEKCQVASIGTAGENLVHFAGINHRGSNSAARCGLGAVLGYKRVKALAIEGDASIEVADPEALSKLRRALVAKYKDDWWISILRSGGTAWGMGVAMGMNDVPIKNWSLESKEWTEEGERVSGQAWEEAGYVTKRRETCFRCPIACRRIVRIDDGPWPVAESAAPEYESQAALSAMLMMDDPLALCKANELCNRYGMDTISTGGTIAWAIEAYERGLLSQEDTNGLELNWGDGQMLLELIERIAHQRDIGILLAGGSRAAARELGGGSEDFAIQAKGLELAMHHPRALRGLEISYATQARGGSHNEGGGWGRQTGSLEEKVAASKHSVDRAMIVDSSVFCNFTVGPLPNEDMARVLEAVTGHKYSPEELLEIGSRIWHLRRAFNLRICDVDGKDDTLPQRVTDELPAEEPLAKSVALYYDARGLDINGNPQRSVLEELSLGDVADDLGL